jgi:hypothetical protein
VLRVAQGGDERGVIPQAKVPGEQDDGGVQDVALVIARRDLAGERPHP